MTEHLEPERMDLASLDIAAEKRAELLRLFPEVQTEGGKVDFDRLRLALGEAVDAGKERYGMNWPGKADCFKAIQRPSLGTLLPVREESVNFDETENLIIEGDNLEVLKLLQKSYQGKVKMIYIDPPYNTGNDFIYPDNYSESLQTYLEYTGQVDSEGVRFSNNSESDGRFHSKWLNMIYPRLYLSRNLLSEDGLLFVSIDDHELENLTRVCNDIYGEEAFLATFVWQRRQVADSRNDDQASTDHEYVVCYKKPGGALRGIEIDRSKYANPDNDPRGLWTSGNLTGLANRHRRPNLHYDLVDPDTGNSYEPSPARGWAYSPATMGELIVEKRILWPIKPTGRPRLKQFLTEVEESQTGFSSILNVGTTTDGTRSLQELFGEKVFPFCKPIDLISTLIEQATRPGDIIVDFFAGSGTTGQSVIELNARDSCLRKFILVQLPEPTGREDYPTIAEITKERIRRVIRREEKDTEGKLDLGNHLKQGFRVLKLATSNFNVWDATTETTAPDALGQQLELHIDHIQKGRYSEDLLYEILLKSGFPLSTPVETFGIDGKAVHSVANGAMLICLDKQLTHEAIKGIADLKPERVVCLDEGFTGNDQLKTNAVLIMKSKGVTKFQTI
jgi:adenine-specific DNA-methyltransferase